MRDVGARGDGARGEAGARGARPVRREAERQGAGHRRPVAVVIHNSQRPNPTQRQTVQRAKENKYKMSAGTSHRMAAARHRTLLARG